MNSIYDIHDIVKYYKDDGRVDVGVISEIVKSLNNDNISYFTYSVRVGAYTFKLDETDIVGRLIMEEVSK